MRFCTFETNGAEAIGVLDPATGDVIDLSVAAPDLPNDLNSLILMGEDGTNAVRVALETAPDAARRAADQVRLLAPIPRPLRNVMCVGRNYHEHAKEFHDSGFDATSAKTAIPDHPIIFTKPSTAVVGPEAEILSFLDPTHTVDYEAELAVIIGKGGRGIKKADAYGHVWGYTIVNDVTGRDLQHRHRQWFIGKGLDSFCPMGPTAVTADEIGDVTKLRMTCDVNGERRQDCVLADLIFDIPTLIETISAGITLLPGDIIATGTPVGVGIGFDPPIFLKPGDVVSITVDPIGELRNTVA